MKYAITTILLIVILFFSLFVFRSCQKETVTPTPKPTETKSATTKPTPARPPIDLKKSIIDRLEKQSLNGVMLAAIKNDVIFQKANGLADQANKTPTQENTQFLIGSITKLFIATAILKLEESGKLDIKKPISTYLTKDNPIWRDDMPAFANSVTIENLLTHTSGIEEYKKLTGFTKFNLKLHQPDEVISLFSAYPLQFSPGTQFNYSGSNYTILGAIIETITENTLANFLQHAFFAPLDMPSTFLPDPVFLSELFSSHPRLGLGHSGGTEAEDINLSSIFASESAISNAPDLFTWTRALFQGKIISEQQLKKMTTTHFKTPNKNIFAGYGLFIVADGQNPAHYVAVGQLDGYEAVWTYEPINEVLLILLSNVTDGKAELIAKDVMQSL